MVTLAACSLSPCSLVTLYMTPTEETKIAVVSDQEEQPHPLHGLLSLSDQWSVLHDPVEFELQFPFLMQLSTELAPDIVAFSTSPHIILLLGVGPKTLHQERYEVLGVEEMRLGGHVGWKCYVRNVSKLSR